LKAEHLHIAIGVGKPFERKALTHYNYCYWGALLQTEYLHHYSCPFESKVGYCTL